jgi:hypothetical protein
VASEPTAAQGEARHGRLDRGAGIAGAPVAGIPPIQFGRERRRSDGSGYHRSPHLLCSVESRGSRLNRGSRRPGGRPEVWAPSRLLVAPGVRVVLQLAAICTTPIANAPLFPLRQRIVRIQVVACVQCTRALRAPLPDLIYTRLETAFTEGCVSSFGSSLTATICVCRTKE